MVLFELVGGRKNVHLVEDGDELSYFPRTVAERAREGRVMEVMDKRIIEEADTNQVRTLVAVALWFVQEAPGIRPSMARVVDMLEGRIRVDPPPDTDFVIVDVFSSVDDVDPGAGGNDRGGGSSLPAFRSVEERAQLSSCSVDSTVLSGR